MVINFYLNLEREQKYIQNIEKHSDFTTNERNRDIIPAALHIDWRSIVPWGVGRARENGKMKES